MRNISYNAIVAGKLSSMMSKKLEPREWGRLGSIIKQGRTYVEHVLDELDTFTQEELNLLDMSLGMFQSLVMLDKNGGDVKKRVGFFINKNAESMRDELIDTQIKGKNILDSLVKHGDT